MQQKTHGGFFYLSGVSQDSCQALFRALWCRMFQAHFQNSYPLMSSYFFHTKSQINLLGKKLLDEIREHKRLNQLPKTQPEEGRGCFIFATSQVLSEISSVWRYLLMKISSRGWRTTSHILVSV